MYLIIYTWSNRVGSSTVQSRHHLFFSPLRFSVFIVAGTSRHTASSTSMGPIRFSLLLGVAKNQNHRITSQEHLTDEAILVDWLGLFLTAMRDLCPHLSHVLQDHVGMTVKGLYTCQNLAVVAAIDEYLSQVFRVTTQSCENQIQSKGFFLCTQLEYKSSNQT